MNRVYVVYDCIWVHPAINTNRVHVVYVCIRVHAVINMNIRIYRICLYL